MKGHSHQLAFGIAPTSPRVRDTQRPKILVVVHDPKVTLGPRRIDVDSLDRTIADSVGRLAVPFEVLGQRHEAELDVGGLEAFDPAALAEQIPLLRELASLCQSLAVPARAEQAARDLAVLLGLSWPADPITAVAAPQPAVTDFSRLLGAAEPVRPHQATVAQLIRGVVDESSDHGAAADPGLADSVAAVRQHVLRQILSDQGFQRQESTWRAVHWLLSRLDPYEGAELWLLTVDVPAALRAPADDTMAFPAEALQQALAANTGGADGAAFAALLVDYRFDSGNEVPLLDRLGELAEQAGAVALVAAPRGLAFPTEGEPGLVSAWEALRRAGHGARIAAAQPRLLLRLPYGARGEATDVDRFEELPRAPDHEAFLWGNPAYGLALIMCLNYEHSGWPPELADVELDGMPMPVYRDSSGDAIMPPAEAYLSEDDVRRLGSLGIMSFLSYRNRDAVRLADFHSIAS